MNFGENPPENTQNATEVKKEDKNSKFNMYAQASREAETPEEKENAKFNLYVQTLKDYIPYLQDVHGASFERNNSNYHKKYEALSLLDLLAECNYNVASSDKKKLLRAIATKVQEDLNTFSTVNKLDRNYLGMVIDLRENIKTVVETMSEENVPEEANDSEEMEESEQSLKYRETVGALRSEFSLMNPSHENDENYHYRHEVFPLLAFLENNNYFETAEDNKLLIKKIAGKLRENLNEVNINYCEGEDVERLKNVRKEAEGFADLLA